MNIFIFHCANNKVLKSVRSMLESVVAVREVRFVIGSKLKIVIASFHFLK